jgi:hypothetical protein
VSILVFFFSFLFHRILLADTVHNHQSSEPTSGLDSTTSFDLVFALGALAKKGVNVITVLHQPSYPLYQMFTNVLLLGKGGRTVFLGKSADALPYFENCGYTMPPFINPADFFMDVIGTAFYYDYYYDYCFLFLAEIPCPCPVP